MSARIMLDEARSDVALEATYEIEALCNHAQNIIATELSGLDGPNYVMRGVIARIRELNSALMSALDDAAEATVHLQRVVVPAARVGVH